MTIAKSLVDELYEVEGKAEIVNGEIVRMSPSGGWPGLAAINIISRLLGYKRRTRRGYVFADNVGFLADIPGRKSFSPDVAYYTGALKELRGAEGLSFLEGAPIFAVEIRSEYDYGKAAERKIAKKIRDYFTAGTLVVWDVDLLSETPIVSYRHDDPDNPIAFRRGETAHAEPAMPDWTFPVDELFLE
ncbi:MAG TPA: Uma2 family endonuclease [Blastocatellia bacterium]|nr:Uma2 family endonuclease [Blastocatellia bacterium]